MSSRNVWLMALMALPTVAAAQDTASPESPESPEGPAVESPESPEAPAAGDQAEVAPAESEADAAPAPVLRAATEPQPAPLPPYGGPNAVPTVQPPSDAVWSMRPYGELRTELSVARLDYLDARTPDVSPTLSLGVSRATFGVGGTYGDHLSLQVSLVASTDPVLQGGATAPSVAVGILDAWTRVDLGNFGALIAGHQVLPFALGPTYGEPDWFAFPDATVHLDLARRSGVLAPRQTSLAWQLSLPMGVMADVAVAQAAEGSIAAEPWIADFAGRLSWAQDGGGGIAGASALLNSRPDGHTHGAWHAYGGYFLDRMSLRVLGEVLGTAGDRSNALGFGVNVAASPALDLGPAESVTVLARLERWDADRGIALDEAIAFDLGATLDFDAGPGSVGVGVVYDLLVPMDPALAIEHDLTFQVRSRF